jgi:hypothetical protein
VRLPGTDTGPMRTRPPPTPACLFLYALTNRRATHFGGSGWAACYRSCRMWGVCVETGLIDLQGPLMVAVTCAIVGCGGHVRADGPPDASSGAPEESGNPDVVMQVEASSCSIVLASNYDQSCSVDTDCVAVSQVSVCPGWGGYGCILWTINKNASAQYMTAISQAIADKPFNGGGSCPEETSPCCLQGRCNVSSCPEPPPQPPLGTDASADDAQVIPEGSVMCARDLGPVDAGVTDTGGPASWCIPPQTCSQYNGQWACCMTIGGSGSVVCRPI